MENESDLSSRGAELLEQLRGAIGRAMVGQNAVIEQVVAALAASGHVLIEGVPGLGKTLLVRALAKALASLIDDPARRAALAANARAARAALPTWATAATKFAAVLDGLGARA